MYKEITLEDLAIRLFHTLRDKVEVETKRLLHEITQGEASPYLLERTRTIEALTEDMVTLDSFVHGEGATEFDVEVIMFKYNLELSVDISFTL